MKCSWPKKRLSCFQGDVDVQSGYSSRLSLSSSDVLLPADCGDEIGPDAPDFVALDVDDEADDDDCEGNVNANDAEIPNSAIKMATIPMPATNPKPLSRANE